VLTNLSLGSSGNLKFRTLVPANNAVNLSVLNLSGGGNIGFGISTYSNDINGVWSLSITDPAPEFTGMIGLTRGRLTFSNSFVLENATLAIDSAQPNSVILANNVSFRNVSFGSGNLTNGTYTATELNAVFNTGRFSGTGTLTVTEPFRPRLVTAAAEPSHPCLFFDSGDISSIQQKVQTGWLREAFSKMKANADVYMTVPTTPYPMSGSSNGDATAGRAINERVNTLTLTGMILNDSSYINKAIDICMAAIHQTTVADFDGYNGHLAIGDALHAYTVAYDWLYNYMTTQQRAALHDEIAEFGVWLYNYSNTGEYYGQYQPTPLSCNHNAIVHGPLGLAALATASHPEWLSRAVSYIGGYFQYSTDATGYNYEGIGYFGYGTLGAIDFAVAYKRAGHADLIAAYPKNFLIPEWILRFMQPWGSGVVALNDSPERMGISSGMMQLISQNRDGVGLWTWLKMYGADGDGTYGGPVGGYIGDGCTIPYVILFADSSLQPTHPADVELPLGMFFDRGSGSFRSSWQDAAALATFTCGFDQHRGHNHRDENSFTFSAFGEYFVIDPGYLPSETRCHNTILVNGIGQGPETNEYDVCGKIADSRSFGSSAWYMRGDALDAFKKSIGLKTASRKFLFAKAPQPYIIISDDITKNSEADFTWLLHTKTNNVVTMGPKTGEFYIQGPEATSAVCFVKFLNPAQDISVAESNLAGQTFGSRGAPHSCKKFFKEVRACYHGVNPKFTAILIAAESIADLPEIQCRPGEAGLAVNVRFKNGTEDRIAVTDDDMNFVRTEAVKN